MPLGEFQQISASSLLLQHRPHKPLTGEEPLKHHSQMQKLEAPSEVRQPYLNVLASVCKSCKFQLHEFPSLPFSCSFGMK